MTKTDYLAALRAAIQAKAYSWAGDPDPRDATRTKLDHFMAQTAETLNGSRNLVNIESASFVEAWRAIGGKGKPTYKALRALPAK